MKMTEMARAIAPHLDQHIIGIRPGEKLHEVMCPQNDAHLTIEFDDHYVIQPTIQFTTQSNFMINASGEHGKYVDYSFEYSSDKNTHWLSHEELIAKMKLTQTEEK